MVKRYDVRVPKESTVVYAYIQITGNSFYILNICTVEPQWLEHLWDHGNLFETWVVRATEG